MSLTHPQPDAEGVIRSLAARVNAVADREFATNETNDFANHIARPRLDAYPQAPQGGRERHSGPCYKSFPCPSFSFRGLVLPRSANALWQILLFKLDRMRLPSSGVIFGRSAARNDAPVPTARCQPTAVSGLTTTSALAHF